MSVPEQTLLGFDYGRSRLGIAVGQTVSASARPLATLAMRGGRPDWSAIARLLGTWAPDALVIGMPSNPHGGSHRLAPAVLRFARQLHGRYGLPVHTVDECLSSHEAQQRGGDVDAVAAQVILETWITQRRGSG